MSESVEEAIAALEDYLRRYPSGHFAELAQVRLDRLLAQVGEKKARVVSSKSNPFSSGTEVANTAYQIGDWYEWRTIDLYTKLERSRVRQMVTAVSDIEVVYDHGETITDMLGNPIKSADGQRRVDAQFHPAEYTLGRKWQTRYRVSLPSGFADEVRLDFVIAAREPISVPAGRFDAFRVEGSGWAMKSGRRQSRYWVAPDIVRRAVMYETWWWDLRGGPFKAERWELVAFQEASR